MNNPLLNGAPWSDHELAALRRLIGLQLPMRTIARKLGRPEDTVRQAAHRVAMADMCRAVTRLNGWPPGY